MVPEEATARLTRLRKTVVASLPDLLSRSSSCSTSSQRTATKLRLLHSKEPLKLPPARLDSKRIGSVSSASSWDLTLPPTKFIKAPPQPLEDPAPEEVSSAPIDKKKAKLESKASKAKGAMKAAVLANAFVMGAQPIVVDTGPAEDTLFLLQHFLGVERVSGIAGVNPPDWLYMEKLMQSGPPDVNFKDEVFGWTPFLFCAHHGRSKMLRLFADNEADLESRCNEGNTALHMSSRLGHHRCVELLLEKKHEINTVNNHGWTPLVWSAMHGHEQVIISLIQAGADVNALDSSLRHAGMWAARHGHAEIVRRLIKAGLDVVHEDASGLNILDHAREYLEMRSAIRLADETNRALVDAAEREDVNAVKEALSAGAYVDSKDTAGRTALSIALAQGSEALVRLLLQRGASTRKATKALVDNACNMAADMAEVLQTTVDASKQLLRSARQNNLEELNEAICVGAVLDAREETTIRTALMNVCSHGNNDAVLSLCKASAAVDSRDAMGTTALIYAVECGTIETVSTLHFYNADPNATNFAGDTGLHMAARADRTYMVQMLLAARGNLEVENGDTYTPLQITTMKGSCAALTTMLAYGADSAKKDPYKRSVFGLAVQNGRVECVRLLLDFLPPPPEVGTKEELAAFRKRHKSEAQAEKIKEKRLERQEAERIAVEEQEKEEERKREKADARRAAREAGAEDDLSDNGNEEMEQDVEEAIPDSFSRLQSVKSESPSKRLGSFNADSENAAESDCESSASSSHTAGASNATDPDEVDKPKKPRPSPFGRFTLIMQAVRIHESLMENEIASPISIPTVVGEEDVNGCGCIHLATVGRRHELVTILLVAKASVNKTDNEGTTPLMMASKMGDQPMVEMLLESGAEAGDKNNKGLRALDIARSSKVKQILTQHLVDKAVKALPQRKKAEPKAEAKAEAKAGAKSKASPATGFSKSAPAPKKIGKKQEDDTDDRPVASKVRLEDLPFKEYAEELEEEIRDCMRKMRVKPLSLDVAINPITCRPLGHALLEFATVEQAETVMEFQGMKVFGQPGSKNMTALHAFREILPPPYVQPGADTEADAEDEE